MKLQQNQNKVYNRNCNYKSTTNLYELALILANGQSRSDENGDSSFVNNLSRICDEFAESRQRVGIRSDNSDLLVYHIAKYQGVRENKNWKNFGVENRELLSYKSENEINTLNLAGKE